MTPRVARVVAFDGGLANMGAVLAHVTERGAVLLDAAVLFSTEKGGGTARRAPGAKTSGATGITASADNRRRTREMSAMVRDFLRGSDGQPRADIVVVEAFSRPPHPSAGAKLAMALAVVEAWCGELGIPTTEVSPQSIKAALGVERGLDKKASKAAVRSAVDLLLYPDGEDTVAARYLLPAGVPAGDHEHPYDALAALFTAVEKDRLRAVLPMVT